jgi:polyhydroxybutyrate depolymerase
MFRRLLAVVCALAVTGVCGRGAEEAANAPGDHIVSIPVGDKTRTCVLHLPPAVTAGKPLPLVLAFHGSGGSGKGMQKTTGFDALADRDGFAVAYPDGLRETRTWNTLYGEAPDGPGILANVDDLGFVRELLGQIKKTAKIDSNRIYACGFSAGAYMAYRLGMEMPEEFAAIGPVCGSLGIKCVDAQPTADHVPEPHGAVSLIHIRGLQDRAVKLEGGQGPKAKFLSTADCVEKFVRMDGDTASPQTTRDDANGLTRTVYSGGKDGREVVLIVVDRCGHEWPQVAKGLNASETLWNFFAAHPRRPR